MTKCHYHTIKKLKIGIYINKYSNDYIRNSSIHNIKGSCGLTAFGTSICGQECL